MAPAPIPGTDVSAQRVEEIVAEVLERPEFRQSEPGFLTAFMEDFFEWLGGLFSSEEVGEAGEAGFQVLLILLSALALTVLILLLVEIARSRSRRARPVISSDVTEEIARRVDQLRAEARLAELDGDWTRALRLFFFATVVGLGERGDLDYRDAWTNRELLERGGPSRVARELLRPLVVALDQHSFGRRPTDAAGVRVFAEACDRLLGGSDR